jgi:peptidoglycan/LPS O-acetylase OafA/YrhL
MNLKTTYLTNLTPLRGIAALLTVIFHVDLMIGGGGNMLVKYSDSLVLTRMYLMVDFFFILSGFIMLHVYGKWFAEKVTESSFKNFTIARFARVYPLHFFTLLYCVLLYTVSGVFLGEDHNPMSLITNNLAAIPANLFLLHSMNTTEWFTWNNASWSISTEWWMYMVFPFLVAGFKKLNTIFVTIVGVTCFVGYLFITYYIVPIVTVPASIPFTAVNPADLSINVSYQYGFLRCFFGFVLGMVVYQFYTKELYQKILGNGIVLLIATFALFICMHFALADVITVILFPIILLSSAFGSANVNAILGSKPLQKLGDWSFSIYLVHQPLLYTIATVVAYMNVGKPQVAGPPPPPPSQLMGWIICIAFIAVTLVVSYFTYRFVELPARNAINRKYGHKNTNITV